MHLGAFTSDYFELIAIQRTLFVLQKTRVNESFDQSLDLRAFALPTMHELWTVDLGVWNILDFDPVLIGGWDSALLVNDVQDYGDAQGAVWVVDSRGITPAVPLAYSDSWRIRGGAQGPDGWSLYALTGNTSFLLPYHHCPPQPLTHPSPTSQIMVAPEGDRSLSLPGHTLCPTPMQSRVPPCVSPPPNCASTGRCSLPRPTDRA